MVSCPSQLSVVEDIFFAREQVAHCGTFTDQLRGMVFKFSTARHHPAVTVLGHPQRPVGGDGRLPPRSAADYNWPSGPTPALGTPSARVAARELALFALVGSPNDSLCFNFHGQAILDEPADLHQGGARKVAGKSFRPCPADQSLFADVFEVDAQDEDVLKRCPAGFGQVLDSPERFF